jgi:hypothetical protein
MPYWNKLFCSNYCAFHQCSTLMRVPVTEGVDHLLGRDLSVLVLFQMCQLGALEVPNENVKGETS